MTALTTPQQARQARSSRYWCHPLFPFHSPQVNDFKRFPLEWRVEEMVLGKQKWNSAIFATGLFFSACISSSGQLYPAQFKILSA
jgi:hypothetical protein